MFGLKTSFLNKLMRKFRNYSRKKIHQISLTFLIAAILLFATTLKDKGYTEADSCRAGLGLISFFIFININLDKIKDRKRFVDNIILFAFHFMLLFLGSLAFISGDLTTTIGSLIFAVGLITLVYVAVVVVFWVFWRLLTIIKNVSYKLFEKGNALTHVIEKLIAFSISILSICATIFTIIKTNVRSLTG